VSDECSVIVLRAGSDLTPLHARALGPLTALLASAIDELGDATAVLHLAPPDNGGRADRSAPGGVRHIWLPPPSDRRVEPTVRTVLAQLRGHVRHVLIDPHPRAGSPDLDRGAARALNLRWDLRWDLRWIDRLATQIVQVTQDAEAAAPPPHPGCEVLRTLVLAQRPVRDRLPPAMHWLEAVARGVARDAARCDAAKGVGTAYQPLCAGPATCRIRLDLRELARTRPASVSALPAPARRTLARWARAVTHRRVGLALGGAGAWGYAGAALIRELDRAGVPIDLIAGTSSGALNGAYYCAAGLAGLDRLIARGRDIARAMPLMVVSSAVAEYLVDADLGDTRLDQLEVPLFPVATNLTELRPEVITAGSIGFGVRASVSAPGIFAPTLAGRARYVDGAVSDNLPVALVESLGADLVIAANALPAAAPGPARGPGSRLGDVTAAFGLLLHVAGEREVTDRRVIYSAGPAAAPLRATFDYGSAERFVARITGDPGFRAAVGAAVAAWRELARPAPRPVPRPRGAAEGA
jgi:predicted acylesterase/phospholipase RssA